MNVCREGFHTRSAFLFQPLSSVSLLPDLSNFRLVGHLFSGEIQCHPAVLRGSNQRLQSLLRTRTEQSFLCSLFTCFVQTSAF